VSDGLDGTGGETDMPALGRIPGRSTAVISGKKKSGVNHQYHREVRKEVSLTVTVNILLNVDFHSWPIG
jgi:hypothetical protein